MRPLNETLDLAKVPPEPPIAVEEVDPEEVEIRRRTVKEWKRWANSRGAASAKFRLAVRQAYGSTCIVCGLHLPATSFNATPGVDAAHILPWSEYDLDETFNGLCLCKLHHWAFDEGLIIIRHEDGSYLVDVPEDVVNGMRAVAGFSIDELLRHAGPINEVRLPARVRDRPRPDLLEMLRRSV
jgi:predicted restriction endonuclease